MIVSWLVLFRIVCFAHQLEVIHLNRSNVFGKDVALFEIEHAVYAAQVYIGNPSKIFNLVVDLYRNVNSKKGVWLERKNCNTCASFKNQYNPKSSSTYKKIANYSSGSVRFIKSFNTCRYYGELASDFLMLNTFSGLSSVRYNLTLASSDTSCSNYSVDGALGLTHKIDDFHVPFVVALKNSGEIDSAVFALYVNNFSMTNKETYPKPSLEVGGFNLQHYSSAPEELVYMKASQEMHWEVIFDTFRFGTWYSTGNISVQFSSTIRYVFGDLNEYFRFVPYLVLQGLTCEQIPKNFVIKCLREKNHPLPSLEFSLGDFKVVLSNNTIWECEKEWCTLLIQFNRAGSWIFGQVFLESYFTIFNYENSSIGFAPAAKSKIRENHEDSFGTFQVLSFIFIVNLV